MADQRLMMRITHANGEYTEVTLAKRHSASWRMGMNDVPPRVQFEEALNQSVNSELMPTITFYYETEKWDWVDPNLNATHEVIP
jgi:hypothetical protein